MALIVFYDDEHLGIVKYVNTEHIVEVRFDEEYHEGSGQKPKLELMLSNGNTVTLYGDKAEAFHNLIRKKFFKEQDDDT